MSELYALEVGTSNKSPSLACPVQHAVAKAHLRALCLYSSRISDCSSFQNRESSGDSSILGNSRTG